MRSFAFTLAAVLFFNPLAFSDEGHHHDLTEQEVGSVHFSTSFGACDPSGARVAGMPERPMYGANPCSISQSRACSKWVKS